MYRTETKRIHKAWKQIKSYIKKHPDWVKGSGAENLKTVGDFKEYYLSMRREGVSKSDLLVVSKLKSQLRFRTELKTARSAVGKGRYIFRDSKGRITKVHTKKSLIGKTYKTESGETKTITLTEFRNMNTRDIADLRKDEIKALYKQLRNGGMESKDAKKEIASFYFGS